MAEAEATVLEFARLLREPPRFPRLDRIASRALEALYRARGLERYDDFRLERVQGLPLVITPTVFNPRLLRTGAYFARCLDQPQLLGGAEVLDMGTGSGVCALVAARHARRVVAVDINPAAVRCAQLNALMNQLHSRVEVRHGDLFGPVPGERFDFILFNPPFVPGQARSDRDRAWRSLDVAGRFAADLAAHLKPGGVALMLLSSFGDAQPFLEALTHHGHALSLHAQRRYVGERLAIFRAAPR